MAVKTITVTEYAYESLKSKKERNESFSETILRITNKKRLSDFFGALSEESAKKMEETIKQMRQIRNKAHHARLKNIVEAFKEVH